MITFAPFLTLVNLKQVLAVSQMVSFTESHEAANYAPSFRPKTPLEQKFWHVFLFYFCRKCLKFRETLTWSAIHPGKPICHGVCLMTDKVHCWLSTWNFKEQMRVRKSFTSTFIKKPPLSIRRLGLYNLWIFGFISITFLVILLILISTLGSGNLILVIVFEATHF